MKGAFVWLDRYPKIDGGPAAAPPYLLPRRATASVRELSLRSARVRHEPAAPQGAERAPGDEAPAGTPGTGQRDSIGALATL